MRIFRRNEDAVSPVIGVILMVAITVILAAVIAAFVFGLGGSQTQAPTASIVASNNPDNPGADLKIQHKGGDLLKASEWKLSIVAIGSSPVYVTASNVTATGDFAVGNQITTTNLTNAGTNKSLTNSGYTVDGGTAMIAANKYDVKLVHIPSNALMLDQVVEVR